MKQPDETFAEFERAATLNPSFVDYRFSLILAFAGEPDRALRVERDYVRLDQFYGSMPPVIRGIALFLLRRFIQVVTTGGAGWRQTAKCEAFEDCFTTSKGARVCVPMAVLPKGRTSHVTRGQFAAFVAAKDHKMERGCWVYDGKEWKQQSHRDWRAPGRVRQLERCGRVCRLDERIDGYGLSPVDRSGSRVCRARCDDCRAPTALLLRQRCEAAVHLWHGAELTAANTYNWDKAVVPQCGDGHATTAPVCSFKPNPFGLFDVHGNAWTWAQDCYKDTYDQAPEDGTKAVTSSECAFRVLRGGSWLSQPQALRSAYRFRCQPDGRVDNVSFRLARTLNP